MIPEDSESKSKTLGTDMLIKNLNFPMSAPMKSVEKEDDKQMQLQPHEHLFFQYLSILAILPNKRQKLLEILDTLGKREKN